MRLGVLTDVHLAPEPRPGARWQNLYDFEGLRGRLDAALARFAAERVDAICLLGDLSDDGDAASTEAVLEAVGACGPPVFVVGGNHDERLDPATLEDALESVENVTLAGGPLPCEQRVVLSHYPLLDRRARLEAAGLLYAGDHPAGAARAERLRADGDSTVVLCGHLHVRESHADGPILQLACAALIEYPFEVALLDADPGAVRIRRIPLAGPGEIERDPVLAPAAETFRFDGRRWQPVS
ncbi:MAG TPA: metallophosphoesterase [Gaiellaceae bacterium]|nr:metallophosphoesterase [Gaiellaceae bacterium]